MTDPDDSRRRRLRDLGWRWLAPKWLFSDPLWRSPGGREMTEEEAFRELEREEGLPS